MTMTVTGSACDVCQSTALPTTWWSLGSPMESLDEELASLRRILAYIVPIALIIAGFGGWFLARRSLSPVVSMADRARRLAGRI